MNSACKGAMLLFAILLLVACQALPLAPTASTSLSAQPTAGASLTEIDLSGIKAYLLDQSQALKTSTEALKAQSDEYYSIAEEAGFDYTILWQERSTEILDILTAARGDWAKASPLYEKMEGIVAGTPALVEYDVILDAGASAAEDPENAVPFDLTLPDGRVLPQPGNLFGVTESTLWGTEPNYIADVEADWDGDGEIEFGETIPDANVLKAGIDALDSYAGELLTSATNWQPTLTDAFSELVIMIPTMNEYFASWRDSRFVSGETSVQRDFVAVSRLSDIQDILSGLQIVYAQVLPLAQSVDAAQSDQIATDLSALIAFVSDIYTQEQGGKRFTPEEADILGAEAQNRATSITGRISQIAGQLGVEIAE